MHVGTAAAGKSENFENIARETNFGPSAPPNMTDDGKLFMALTSTTGRLTNLKESPF